MFRTAGVTMLCLMDIMLAAPDGVRAPASQPARTLWDMARLGLFDPTNKSYVIEDGLVDVDLSRSSRVCPTGLGHLASGMDSVRGIRLVFDCPHAGDYWLHVKWTPGASGDEQFELLLNDKPVGASQLVKAAQRAEAVVTEAFPLTLPRGKVALMLRHLSGDGLRFEQIALGPTPQPPHAVRADLKYPTLSAYEQAIQEAGVVLEGEHVVLFASKKQERQARVVHDRLVRAYDALHATVGVHTPYKIVVYHFPDGHRDARGGTSNCVIWYSHRNLDPTAWEEWRRYKVPHVCGYIEEMAHNFVSASGAQFGWEMIGWSIGVKTTQTVAPNPVFAKDVADTRRGQAETFARYVRDNYTFPADLPANQVDRIHAHLLNLCERRYGPKFWPDFFAEIRKAQAPIDRARAIIDADKRRDALYVITLGCLDRIKGLGFTELLKENQISLTTDIKSLRPTDEGWNRKLLSPSEQ